MFKNPIKLNVLLRLTGFNNTTIIKRLAGHSKWANIKHQKAIEDAKRANIFTKLGRAIKVAIAEGGSPDPTKNLKLEQVIQQARRVNMPLATVQSVIKSSQLDKSKAKQYILEIIGPGGCFILCDIYTNSFHQTKQSMASILKKHNAKFTEGGAKHLFEQKGIVFANKPDDVVEKEILEVATEHAIDCGAEDVTLFDESTLQFTCAASSLLPVVKELEKLAYKIKDSDLEYVPLKLHPVSDNDLDVCSSLYEKLENMPQVVKLFDNIA